MFISHPVWTFHTGVRWRRVPRIKHEGIRSLSRARKEVIKCHETRGKRLDLVRSHITPWLCFSFMVLNIWTVLIFACFAYANWNVKLCTHIDICFKHKRRSCNVYIIDLFYEITHILQMAIILIFKRKFERLEEELRPTPLSRALLRKTTVT
jgi:hypothetical protein